MVHAAVSATIRAPAARVSEIYRDYRENQMTKSYRKAYEERLPVMLQGPRTASVLRYVKEWHRE